MYGLSLIHRVDTVFHHSPARIQPPSHLSSALRRLTIVCSEPGCDGTVTVRCSYLDSHLRSCGGSWCNDHRQMAVNAMYCQRHVEVIQTLAANYSALTVFARR